jgi:hypothetical protein
VDSRRRLCSVAAEHDPGRVHAVRREVDQEDVGVVRVVGMQPKVSVKGRYRAQGPKHELATPDADLDSGAEHGPRLHVGLLGSRPVPAAEVAPDLGMLRHVGADAITWGADQVAEQPLRLPRRRQRRRALQPVASFHRSPIRYLLRGWEFLQHQCATRAVICHDTYRAICWSRLIKNVKNEKGGRSRCRASPIPALTLWRKLPSSSKLAEVGF